MVIILIYSVVVRDAEDNLDAALPTAIQPLNASSAAIPKYLFLCMRD